MHSQECTLPQWHCAPQSEAVCFSFRIHFSLNSIHPNHFIVVSIEFFMCLYISEFSALFIRLPIRLFIASVTLEIPFAKYCACHRTHLNFASFSQTQIFSSYIARSIFFRWAHFVPLILFRGRKLFAPFYSSCLCTGINCNSHLPEDCVELF